MQYGARFDVSVIVPFADDEDVIGSAVQRIAAHVRELGLSFEILAVDEDSGDNSHAVIALLRAQVPELRVLHAPGLGRGFESGIGRAQGRVLWLIEPTAAVQPLAGFARAFDQILDEGADGRDAAIVRGRFAVLHRMRALPATAGVRGTGDVYYKRLARRLAGRGLRLDVQLRGGAPAAVQATAPAWDRSRPAGRAIIGIRRIGAAFFARRGGLERTP